MVLGKRKHKNNNSLWNDPWTDYCQNYYDKFKLNLPNEFFESHEKLSQKNALIMPSISKNKLNTNPQYVYDIPESLSLINAAVEGDLEKLSKIIDYGCIIAIKYNKSHIYQLLEAANKNTDDMLRFRHKSVMNTVVNGFQFFYQANFTKLKAKYGNSVMRELKRQWDELSIDDRRHYENEAKTHSKQYIEQAMKNEVKMSFIDAIIQGKLQYMLDLVQAAMNCAISNGNNLIYCKLNVICMTNHLLNSKKKSPKMKSSSTKLSNNNNNNNNRIVALLDQRVQMMKGVDMSGYDMFVKSSYARLCEMYPDMSDIEMTNKILELWECLPVEEHQLYCRAAGAQRRIFEEWNVEMCNLSFVAASAKGDIEHIRNLLDAARYYATKNGFQHIAWMLMRGSAVGLKDHEKLSDYLPCMISPSSSTTNEFFSSSSSSLSLSNHTNNNNTKIIVEEDDEKSVSPDLSELVGSIVSHHRTTINEEDTLEDTYLTSAFTNMHRVLAKQWKSLKTTSTTTKVNIPNDTLLNMNIVEIAADGDLEQLRYLLAISLNQACSNGHNDVIDILTAMM